MEILRIQQKNSGIRQSTPEEGQTLHRPKHCANNN